MKQKRLLILVFYCSFFIGCEELGLNKWDGFFYKNGNTFNVIRGGPFKSKDECLAWATNMVRNEADDYECGKNCKGNEFGLFTCDETLDG